MAPAAEVKRPRWADMEDSDGEQHDRAGGWQQWADTSNEEHHAAGESSSAAPSEHTESKAHVSTLHLKRCVGGKKAAVTNGDNANLRAKGQLSEARKAYEELKSDMPKEVVEGFETAWNLFKPLVGRPHRENRYVQAWVRKSRVDYCRKVLNEYQRETGGQAALGLKFILQDVKDISCKCNGMNHNILLNAVNEKVPTDGKGPRLIEEKLRLIKEKFQAELDNVDLDHVLTKTTSLWRPLYVMLEHTPSALEALAPGKFQRFKDQLVALEHA